MVKGAPVNMSKWGRDKARQRYDRGGRSPTDQGGGPEHEKGITGGTVPFPIGMRASDLNRLRSMQGIESGRIKPKDNKPLHGPGYTEKRGGKVK